LIWTSVRRGNRLKKRSNPVTAIGKMGQFASIANRAVPVLATAGPSLSSASPRGTCQAPGHDSTPSPRDLPRVAHRPLILLATFDMESAQSLSARGAGACQRSKIPFYHGDQVQTVVLSLSKASREALSPSAIRSAKVDYTYKNHQSTNGDFVILVITPGEQNGHYHRKYLCTGNP